MSSSHERFQSRTIDSGPVIDNNDILVCILCSIVEAITRIIILVDKIM